MAGPMMGGMNPMLALLPPDQQQSYMQLQQQQALAQAMLQQGMQPQDMGQNPVGGMAYHVSPLNGVNKVLQTYLGTKMGMNAMGQQAQLMGQMYGNAFGTNQPQAQPQQASTDAGGMTDGQSGPGVQSMPVSAPGAAPSGAQIGAAMGGGAAPAQMVPQQQMPNGALTLPGKTPQQSMLLFSMLGPDAYGKMLEAQTAPTAATLAARQGGFDPMAANQAQFRKDSYVAPLTGTGIMRNPFNPSQPVAFNPEVPAGATPMFDASGNVVAEKSIPGAQGVMQGNAAATAAGGAQFKPVQVYNKVTHQMDWSNEGAVTNPGSGGGAAPTLSGIFAQQESGGGKTAPDNPYQIQQGTFKQYAQPGESWSNVSDRNTVAQRVLTTYQQKYGGDLGRIATAYFSGEGNVAPAGSPTPFIKNVSDSNGKSVASYVGDIYARGAGMPSGGGAAPQGGAPAAAPPLGVIDATNAAQTAPSKQMATSYGAMSTADSNYQQSREALTDMINLANNKGASGGAVGLLPESVATRISPDAAKYQKLHATYIALQGNAAGPDGTNASRATLDESVPTYDKPQSAMVSGLQTQLSNLDRAHLKTQFLAPTFRQGDEKAFTDKSAGFDQNVTPPIVPILQMSGGAQQAAVQAAIKDNPSLRPNFEWAFNNGLLK